MLNARSAAASDGQAILLGATGDSQNHMSSSTSIVADTSAYTTGNAFTVDASGLNVAALSVGAIRGKGAGGYAGLAGFGGGISGPGVYAEGGAGNGNGVYAVGTGTASAVFGTGSASGLGGAFQGGRSPINLSPAATAGPPTTGSHGAGDVWVDSNGTHWLCTAAGMPGTFYPVQTGGLNQALYTAVSTQQYTTTGSDGTTWVDLDGTNLKLTITPSFNCQAILSGNSDLWTSTSGVNQDLGITISGGAYPTVAGQPGAGKRAAASPGPSHRMRRLWRP
jgi:hypothetical protein